MDVVPGLRERDSGLRDLGGGDLDPGWEDGKQWLNGLSGAKSVAFVLRTER